MTMSTRQLLVLLVLVLGGLSAVVARHLQDIPMTYPRFSSDPEMYDDDDDLEIDPYLNQIYLEKLISKRYEDIDNELPYIYEQVQQRGRRQAQKTRLRGPSLCHFKICNMGKKKKTRA